MTKFYCRATAMFDMVECDTAKIARSGTNTLTEDFYEWLENKYFDPIRDKNAFKKLKEA